MTAAPFARMSTMLRHLTPAAVNSSNGAAAFLFGALPEEITRLRRLEELSLVNCQVHSVHIRSPGLRFMWFRVYLAGSRGG